MNGDSQSGERPAQPEKPGSTISLPPLTEQPGTRIGRYKLLQQIGEGGCGVVYMAEQSEPVKRKVALKVIKLGMDTKQVVARFEAERQALAIMDHPNIAKVLDGGATENGRPFFVMELVAGIKLTDYCDKHKLSTHERLELFIQVCHAIQHAHQKGIIHRDIKPSNVLVTLDLTHKPLPKVIDFGIAKATTGQALTDKTLFTAYEQFIGTPAYMSPEQADLTGLDIDTRTDIYSLGVLLYELLTGKTPFDTEELLKGGLDTLRQTLRDKEATTPSMRLKHLTPTDLTQVAERHHAKAPELIHSVRGDLDWIVLKCLEKDRTRRYETANGIAMDLQRYLNNEPIVARPPSTLYRFGKMVRRNKVAFAAVNAVALAIAIGFGVSTRLYLKEKAARADALAQKEKAEQAREEAEEQRDSATKAKTIAETNLQAATKISEFLQSIIGGMRPDNAAGKDTTLLRELLDRMAGRIETEVKGQPGIKSRLLHSLSIAFMELNEPEKALPLARKSVDLRKSLAEPPNAPLAYALQNLRNALVSRGKESEAEVVGNEYLEVAIKVFGESSREVADAFANAGWFKVRKMEHEEAEASFRRALAIDAEFPNALHGMAATRVGMGDLKTAEDYAHRALAGWRTKLGSVNTVVAETLNTLGLILSKRGDLSGAETAFHECVAIRKKLLGASAPKTVAAEKSLNEVIEAQGKNPSPVPPVTNPGPK